MKELKSLMGLVPPFFWVAIQGTTMAYRGIVIRWTLYAMSIFSTIRILRNGAVDQPLIDMVLISNIVLLALLSIVWAFGRWFLMDYLKVEEKYLAIKNTILSVAREGEILSKHRSEAGDKLKLNIPYENIGYVLLTILGMAMVMH